MPMTIVHVSVGSGFRTPATSKVKIFVKTISGFQLLTFVTKSTLLVVEKILYPPLFSVLMPSSIFRHKTSLVWENKSSILGYFTRVYWGILLGYILLGYIYTWITQLCSKSNLTFDSVTVVRMSFCWRHPNWKCIGALWSRLQVMCLDYLEIFNRHFCKLIL